MRGKWFILWGAGLSLEKQFSAALSESYWRNCDYYIRGNESNLLFLTNSSWEINRFFCKHTGNLLFKQREKLTSKDSNIHGAQRMNHNLILSFSWDGGRGKVVKIQTVHPLGSRNVSRVSLSYLTMVQQEGSGHRFKHCGPRNYDKCWKKGRIFICREYLTFLKHQIWRFHPSIHREPWMCLICSLCDDLTEWTAAGHRVQGSCVF